MVDQTWALHVAQAPESSAIGREADNLQAIEERLALRDVIGPFPIAVGGACRQKGDIATGPDKKTGQVQKKRLSPAYGSVQRQSRRNHGYARRMSSICFDFVHAIIVHEH